MFSAGIERALQTAIEAHAGQFRKGIARAPYAVHPLHVALMLARFDATEEVLQAALLHDVVEDCEGWTPDRIEQHFGARVRSIVAELTEDKRLSWSERKQHAIDHVPTLSPEAAAVKACDKLHNLASLHADLERTDDPEQVWSKFKGGRAGTLDMARGLVDALCERVQPALANELQRTLAAVEAHGAG